MALLGSPAPDLERLLADCTQPDAEARPASAQVLRKRLLDVHVEADSAAPTPSQSTASSTWTPPEVSAPLPPQFGREAELAEVLAALDQHPVVVLKAAAGLGKTYLARHVAAARSPGVVCQVAECVDEDAVLRRLADTLGVRLGLGDGLPALVRAAQRLGLQLVVFDGAERCAHTLPRILQLLSRRVPVLVTSRVGLDGHTIELAGLSEPDAVTMLGLAGATWPASRLQPLARALEGWPLALELVAPRLRVLTPEQVLARLDRVLGRGSLSAALDWSWQVLSPQAQVALARLAAFARRVDPELAEEVLGDDAFVLDRLDELVEHSWLSSRLTMLDAVRSYVRRELPDEVGIGRRRHAEAYARRADTAWTAWSQPIVRRRMLAERAELEAACGWAVEIGDVELATQLLLAVGGAFLLAGPVQEGSALFERVFALAGEPDQRARLLSQSGQLAYLAGNASPWLPHWREALEVLPPGTPRGRALAGLAHALWRTGELGESELRYHEAIDELRAAGDEVSLGVAIGNLGIVLQQAGRMDEARGRFEGALEEHRRVGNRREEGNSLGNLATIATWEGRHRDAISLFEQAIAAFRDAEDLRGEAIAHANLAIPLNASVGPGPAAEAMNRGADLARRIGDTWIEAAASVMLGPTLVSLLRPRQARTVLEDGLEACLMLGDPRFICQARSALGQVLFDLGEVEPAIAALQRALQEAIEHDVPQQELAASLNLGIATGDTGDWETSSAYLARALELAHDGHMRVAEVRIQLALHALDRGDFDAAAGSASEAVAELDAEEPHGLLARAVLALARAQQGHAFEDPQLPDVSRRPKLQVMLATLLALASGDASVLDTLDLAHLPPESPLRRTTARVRRACETGSAPFHHT
jgi:tetratricopeptide (TPR) repeat protein